MHCLMLQLLHVTAGWVGTVAHHHYVNCWTEFHAYFSDQTRGGWNELICRADGEGQ